VTHDSTAPQDWWLEGKALERGTVKVRIDQGADLRVAIETFSQGQPEAVPAVRSAIAFHEAWFTLSVDDALGVRSAIRDTHGVEHGRCVLHQAFLKLTAASHWALTKVYSRSTVGLPLVVLPNRDTFVHTVTGDEINNVLSAAQILLHEGSVVSSSQGVEILPEHVADMLDHLFL
jgi:hypothetical protein